MALTTAAATSYLADSSKGRDQLEDELDDYDVPSHIREQRLREYTMEMNNLKKMSAAKHGDYTEVATEKEFLDITTKESTHVICHFFHKNFKTCEIVDKHLEPLAKKFFDTRFIKLDVEKCPFLVLRLKLKVLPVICCLVDGIVKEKLIGFDELGMTDAFTTETLETRLVKTGTLRLTIDDTDFTERAGGVGGGRGDGSATEEDDSDYEEERNKSKGRMQIRGRQGRSRKEYNSDEEDWD